MITAADPWAIAAANLPLAFSQVREDPRLDLEIARRLPTDARVMMIASGGETAVCLARLPLAQLILVDVNPAQLALTRCRMHLAQTRTPVESMALLGHVEIPADERWEKWQSVFETLDLPHDSLGPQSLVASLGADHCGRYEAAFAELRRLLSPVSNNIAGFLNQTDAPAASRLIERGTETGDALDSAFAAALRLENLVALFGKGATQNPQRPFHQHFIHQLREICSRQPPVRNPWIWQILAGKFPPGVPADWLLDAAPLQTSPGYLQTPMHESLEDTAPATLDFIHLSNILDWLSPEEAGHTLTAARRALKPAGFLLIRQLNSSLDIPSLCPSLHWHRDEGRRLQLMDRSFFYPEILLASRS